MSTSRRIFSVLIKDEKERGRKKRKKKIKEFLLCVFGPLTTTDGLIGRGSLERYYMEEIKKKKYGRA